LGISIDKGFPMADEYQIPGDENIWNPAGDKNQ